MHVFLEKVKSNIIPSYNPEDEKLPFSSFHMKTAKFLLKNFFEECKKLDSLKSSNQHILIKRNSKEWMMLIDSVGKSFLYLYKFHTLLRLKHSYFRDKDTLEDQLISFYMDMVLSKLKHTFYTEYPNEPIYSIDHYRSADIYEIGINIIYEDGLENIKSLLSVFYYKIFLLYDFLYSKSEKHGIFTNFQQNKELYQKVNLNININSINDYRNKTESIIENTLNDQLDIFSNQDSEKLNIYDQYVKNCGSKNNCYIEPISYFTAFKFWKIRKFLQDRFEERLEDIEKYDRDFEKAFEKYKKCVIDNNNKLYNKSIKYSNRDYYREIYNCDLNFAQTALYKWIHPKNNVNNINNNIIYKDIELLEVDTEEVNTEEVNTEEVIKNGINKIYHRFDDGRDPWKFNRIFNYGTKNEIEMLIYSLNTQISSNLQYTSLIGLYKSGALLAHCINITSRTFKSVKLFTTFPYVAIHPRSTKVRSQSNSYLIVDESFKTGFTAEIACEYINRNGNPQNYFEICSVVNFDTYDKIGELYPDIYIATMEKNKNYFTLNASVKNNKISNNIFTIENFIKNLKDNESYKQHISSKHLIKKAEISVNNKIEYDVTRLLSDSVLLFSIAMYFLEEIRSASLSKFNDVIFINAPTDEGRLIAETIALISKISDDNSRFIFQIQEFKDANEYENSYKVFMDLSIDSGTTMKNSIERDINLQIKNSIKFKNIKKFEEFDLICCIFGRENKEKQYNYLATF